MSNMKICDSAGEPITVQVPALTGVEPTGSQVLVEMLTPQEILGTNLVVGDSAKDIGAPQAYVKALGPRVATDNKSEKPWGFSEGNRVVLSGNFTPLPEIPGFSDRMLALVEPHAIKAVLVE